MADLSRKPAKKTSMADAPEYPTTTTPDAMGHTVPSDIQMPAHSAVHGKVPRGLMYVPHSALYQGRFGRMFRKLAPLSTWTDQEYQQLADTMRDGDPVGTDGDNPHLPAGYTYLGQFIDHDITFDPNSKLQQDNDPNALQNFRTPRYDLDSIYGGGPADNPFMYQIDGMRLVVGTHPDGSPDCPRVPSLADMNGSSVLRAVIGDPRNDENIIVNQLHLAFISYHNAVVDELVKQHNNGTPLTAAEIMHPEDPSRQPELDADTRGQIFDEARRITRWHYQWVVVHDFLERIVGKGVVDDLMQGEEYTILSSANGGGPQFTTANTRKILLKFFDWKHDPYIPVEFSVAAYRFGHSMVRVTYRINEEIERRGGPPDIVIFHGPDDDNIRTLLGVSALNPFSMEGFNERPRFWEIEWDHFFDFGNDTPRLQASRRIDTRLATGLHTLPKSVTEGIASLATRNLLRGQALGLPSGQTVARAMGIPEALILDESHLSDLPDGLRQKVGTEAPLWYYILREAEEFTEGTMLGPVGGRIVAEVFLGLLKGDPGSAYNISPGWEPTPGQFGAVSGTDNVQFGMPELLTFAGVKLTATPQP
ncbi:MAG: peroxidase family protein [Chloroflexota bacterium]